MRTILIIEDEEKVRKLYAQLLREEGYDVLEARDCARASDLLNKKKIDLVLLDIKLPVVYGSILYEFMQTFHQGVKVIVSSVYPLDEQKVIVRGAADYYDKSHGTETLLTKIKRALPVEGSAPA